MPDDSISTRGREPGVPAGAAPDAGERAELTALLDEARRTVKRLERALEPLDEAELHPIVRLRRRRGMSQAELARAVGISPPALCRIENAPGLAARDETRRRLAEALGVPEGDLVHREG